MKHRILKTGLSALLAVTLAACSSSSEAASSTASTAAVDSSTVNVGATDTLGNALNPLIMDWTFINMYATSLEFLPLVSIGSDYEIDYMLAESITTEDNLTFNVKLKDDAKWSDGEDITADDVIYTILKMTSPSVANANFDFSGLEGISDDNLSPEGAESIDGLEKVSDKELNFIFTSPVNLNTFINNMISWILIVPEHVLGDLSDSELLTTDFWSNPSVVSGPYIAQEYDSNHYISYSANENYFLGAPNISLLNIRIVEASELLTGLQTGELDMILPSSANVPAEDRDAVEALDGFTAAYTDPITEEMTYFNTSKISDERVRKAFVEAIDRDQLVEVVLGGHGENTDGFIPTGSPYYDEDLSKIEYDPDDAKALLEEAGWDSSTELEYYVSSSDANAVKSVEIMKEELAAVGITINIHTVDFATLMEVGGSDDVDIFSVQYTITPNDYYADLVGLIDVEGSSWTGGYFNEEVDSLLSETQEATDEAETASLYQQVDEIVIEEVPLFSLYFLGNLGVVSDHLKNASATTYGVFNNVETWTKQ